MSGGTPWTAGPWVVCIDDEFDGCRFIPIETDQPTGPLCRLVCEVRPDGDDLADVDRANARLIAAATEMAEALLAAGASLQWWQKNEPASFGNIERTALEKVSAVLTKIWATQ